MKHALVLLMCLSVTPAWAEGASPIAEELRAVAEAPERTDTLFVRRREAAERRYVADLSAAKDSAERGDAVARWGRTLKDLGVPNAELLRAYETKVMEMTRIDFYAAFKAVVASHFPTDQLKGMLDSFPPGQREAVRKLAQYDVKKFYDSTTPYPEDVPAPGHAWGDLTRTSVASAVPTASPTPAAWVPLYRPGQFFQTPEGHVWGVLTKVDSRAHRYLVLTRKFYPRREPYYLYAEEYGNYAFDEVWFDESDMAKAKPAPDQYTACDSCGGEGCQYDDVTRVRGGKWEEVNSVVKVYTPQRVTSSYKRKVRCGRCAGAGWKKL